MKKLLCVIPALLLFAMIGAPNARADSYAPTFTCQAAVDCALGPPTAPDVTFSPGEPTGIFVSATPGTNPVPLLLNLSLPAADAPGDTYLWIFFAGFINDTRVQNFSIFDETNGLEVSVPFSGNYSEAADGPLTFTSSSAATPEPEPILLLLLGVGLILFRTRKRLVMRIPRTA